MGADEPQHSARALCSWRAKQGTGACTSAPSRAITMLNRSQKASLKKHHALTREQRIQTLLLGGETETSSWKGAGNTNQKNKLQNIQTPKRERNIRKSLLHWKFSAVHRLIKWHLVRYLFAYLWQFSTVALEDFIHSFGYKPHSSSEDQHRALSNDGCLSLGSKAQSGWKRVWRMQFEHQSGP